MCSSELWNRCNIISFNGDSGKPGDEIITTPFTWASNVEMIKILGATPIYVDIDIRNFNMNAKLIKKKITKKQKQS